MCEALIARLEKATGPNREIDARIWAEIDGRDVYEADGMLLGRNSRPPHDVCRLGYVDPGRISRNFSVAQSRPPIPIYTASIDAALTLVPEGLFYLLGNGRVRSGEPLYGILIMRPSQEPVANAEHDTSFAICVALAALRARQTMKENAP